MNRQEWFNELKRLATVIYFPHVVSREEIENWKFADFEEYYEDGMDCKAVLIHYFNE